MRRKLLFLIASVGTMAALSSASAFALPPSQLVRIRGAILDNHQGVSGASVTVTCKGVSRHTKTSGNGTYLVNFPIKVCPMGSTVTVSASKNGMSGSNSSMTYTTTTNMNVGLVIVQVPELGNLLTVAGALAGGAGAFWMIRRRSFTFSCRQAQAPLL
jgi:hypothetical protein